MDYKSIAKKSIAVGVTVGVILGIINLFLQARNPLSLSSSTSTILLVVLWILSIVIASNVSCARAKRLIGETGRKNAFAFAGAIGGAFAAATNDMVFLLFSLREFMTEFSLSFLVVILFSGLLFYGLVGGMIGSITGLIFAYTHKNSEQAKK